MSDPRATRFQQWAIAQASALAAERRIAEEARASTENLSPPPSAADIQAALTLRNKATALLMAVLSEANDAPTTGFSTLIRTDPSATPDA